MNLPCLRAILSLTFLTCLGLAPQSLVISMSLLVFDAVLPSLFPRFYYFSFSLRCFYGLLLLRSTDFGCLIHLLFPYFLSSCMIYYNDIKDPLRLRLYYGLRIWTGRNKSILSYG